MNLKPETLEKIDALIPRYPEKRSAALPLLHYIQAEHGYISKQSVQWVAEKLELEPINVWELVTFYPMLKEQPIGKLHIKVCRTLSCALAGSYAVKEKFEAIFKAQLAAGESTPEGEQPPVSIEFVECIASCGTAPVVQINQRLHEGISLDKVEAFAEEMRATVGV